LGGSQGSRRRTAAALRARRGWASTRETKKGRPGKRRKSQVQKGICKNVSPGKKREKGNGGNLDSFSCRDNPSWDVKTRQRGGSLTDGGRVFKKGPSELKLRINVSAADFAVPPQGRQEGRGIERGGKGRLYCWMVSSPERLEANRNLSYKKRHV